MTEKEKQQSGELYSASDMELLTERIKARKLCAEYNAAEYNDFQRKARLLERLVAFKGEGVTFEPDFFCNYGYNIFIGNNFRADYNCIIIDNAEVTFGDNVFIGPNCSFNTAVRPLDPETRNQRLEMAKPIKVGSNVDIGGNVTVAAGVTIGDNVIITAGSAVTEDVPSNCIASGNPCVKVKELPAYDSGTEKAPEKKPETPEKERKGRRLILEPVTPGASSESSKPAAPEKDKFPGNGRPEREGFSNNGRPESEGFSNKGRPESEGFSNKGRPERDGFPGNGRPERDGFPGNGRPEREGFSNNGRPEREGFSNNGRPERDGFPGNGRPERDGFPGNGRPEREGFSNNGRPEMEGFPITDLLRAVIPTADHPRAAIPTADHLRADSPMADHRRTIIPTADHLREGSPMADLRRTTTPTAAGSISPSSGTLPRITA